MHAVHNPEVPHDDPYKDEGMYHGIPQPSFFLVYKTQLMLIRCQNLKWWKPTKLGNAVDVKKAFSNK